MSRAIYARGNEFRNTASMRTVRELMTQLERDMPTCTEDIKRARDSLYSGLEEGLEEGRSDYRYRVEILGGKLQEAIDHVINAGLKMPAKQARIADHVVELIRQVREEAVAKISEPVEKELLRGK